jgi:hypothetical protein
VQARDDRPERAPDLGERVLHARRHLGVDRPRPGGMVEPATLGRPERWWPVVPWRTAGEAPVWSTGVRRTTHETQREPSGVAP